MRKKLLIFLIIFLIILITLIILTESLLKGNKAVEEEIISPTPILDYGSYTRSKKSPESQSNTALLTPSPQNPSSLQQEPKLSIMQQEILKQVRLISPDELSQIENLKKILPFETNDFGIDYSPLLDKFILTNKTALAENKFKEWLNKNGFTKITEDQRIMITTDEPIDIFKTAIEASIQEAKDTSIKSQPGFTSTSSNQGFDLSMIEELLKKIFSNEALKDFQGPTTSPQNSGGGNITNPGFGSVSSSLGEVFNEVGARVGIPARIMEGVMRIEYPSTFNLTSSEISAYSTPGNTISGCGPNFCSATGPMQMTIGIDDKGGNCSSCTGGGCPNAWGSYGRSVNTYGGYSHNPNPCNLKDNVYAAALKLKNDSGASDPNNWTQQEVYRAAERYYGSCSDKYRYDRLGGRTYCEFLWWYYKNNPQSSGSSNNTLQSVLSWTETINNNLEKGSVDPSYYNRLINTPQNAGYTASYRTGQDSGVGPSGTYWCTNSVIDSYNLAGIKGLGPQHQAVINMRSFWMNNPGFKYVANSSQALNQVQPGCALFFEKTPGVQTGLEHTAIIKNISIDSNQNGLLETYDSNSVVKTTRYPVLGGDVKNTPLGEILVGFGCL